MSESKWAHNVIKKGICEASLGKKKEYSYEIKKSEKKDGTGDPFYTCKVYTPFSFMKNGIMMDGQDAGFNEYNFRLQHECRLEVLEILKSVSGGTQASNQQEVRTAGPTEATNVSIDDEIMF